MYLKSAILNKMQKEFEASYLEEVVDKTADFLHGVGYCFEDLRTQIYPVPDTNSDT